MSVFRFTSAWNAAAARSTAEIAKDRARSAEDDVASLRGQVDRLQMICEAMWTIVRDRLGIADEDLSRLVEEIDLRDGKSDGRSQPAAPACARCGRVVSARTRVCIYCGAQNFAQGVF